MILDDRPTVGPLPHTYVDLGTGACVCGLPRFTGCHVARADEQPLPDLAGVRATALQAAAALQALVAAIDGAEGDAR
jgi:hypothetical protein